MIPIVFSTDHNFVMPTGVALQSLLDNLSDKNVNVYIIQSDNVTDIDREALSVIAEKYGAKINFLSNEGEFNDGFEIRGISRAAYFRLLIPWLLPEYDIVLYLDGDIIVKTDITGIIDHISIADNNYLYGVRTPGFTLDPSVMNYINSIGLDNRHYINSGVLIINSKLMREHNLKDVFISYGKKQFLYQDQDIVNLVCEGKIGWLPLKYNRSVELEVLDKNKLVNEGVTTDSDFNDALNTPSIIHYAGKKPWKDFTYHWYDWWSEYSRSPFYDYKFSHEMAKSIQRPQYSKRQLVKMMLKSFLGK